MFNSIERFLKSKTDEFVFIELKEDKKFKEKGYPPIKDIPLPIPLNDVVNKVKKEVNEADISLLKIVEGMIFIIGIDSSFNYNKTYRDFLFAFDKEIDATVVKQGLKYITIDKKIEALICFKAGIFLNNDNLDALYNYGRCCEEISGETNNEGFAKNLEEEALKVFEELVNEFPEFSLSYYHLGFHYANKSQYKKAELTWKNYIEYGEDDNKKMEVYKAMDELNHKIKYEEGYSLVLEGKPDEGLDALLPLVENYPDWWNLLFFIGLAYRSKGEFSKAIKYFKKIIDINPDQVDTLNEIGLCYSSLGNYEDSIKCFLDALELRDNDSEILCNLGMAYMEKGDYDSAQKHIMKSFKINPDDSVTQACIQQLNKVLNNTTIQ